MSFPLSRTMRLSDYEELKNEVSLVDHVALQSGGMHPAQHTHRRWEYALLMKAYDLWAKGRKGLQVGDFGCGVGLSPALMLSQGNYVSMYEVWVSGNWEAQLLGSLQTLQKHNPVAAQQKYGMVHRPLCELVPEDHNWFDVSLCISTLEHIGEYEKAFRDLCRTVKYGGLMFLTMDFADNEVDNYVCSWLRAGRMPTFKYMTNLFEWGEQEGFHLLGGETDWSFTEENRLVNDYGFASLAMVKE